MSTQKSFNKKGGKRVKDKNYFPYNNGSYNSLSQNQNSTYVNQLLSSNDLSTTDTDNISYKSNNVMSTNYDKPKPQDNRIVLKQLKEFANELFKIYGEKNSLCNFTLFEKNIDIKMNIENLDKNSASLYDYFECFNEASFLCLNIPYLDKKGNVSHNIFNPTLSFMTLVIMNQKKKIKEANINRDYLKKNFSITFLPDDTIKIDFDETNPP